MPILEIVFSSALPSALTTFSAASTAPTTTSPPSGPGRVMARWLSTMSSSVSSIRYGLIATAP